MKFFGDILREELPKSGSLFWITTPRDPGRRFLLSTLSDKLPRWASPTEDLEKPVQNIVWHPLGHFWCHTCITNFCLWIAVSEEKSPGVVRYTYGEHRVKQPLRRCWSQEGPGIILDRSALMAGEYILERVL
jgi:hypothetical protein